MKVNVNVGGVDVPVELNENQVEEIKAEGAKELAQTIVREFIKDIVENESYDDLTEEEIEKIISEFTHNTYISDGKLCYISYLVSDTMRGELETMVRETLENRAKWFHVEMSMTNTFSIYVKARTEREASDFAESLTYHDLSAVAGDADMYDAEFCVDNVEPNDGDTDNWGNPLRDPSCRDDVFDATED